MIQLHRLEGFYRVALAEGYARAAKTFPYPITQPAVHQQVKKLERELGTTLFRRAAKDRVALTRSGRHLFEFCAPYFERLPSVVHELQSGAFGTLRIDAGPQEIRHIVPAWLSRLRRRTPQLRIELEEIARVDADRLRRGQCDIILEYFPDPPADIAQTTVATVHTLWVLPAEHTLRGRIELKALARVPFVGFSAGSSEYHLQRRALSHVGLAPPSVLHASSVEAILGFVQAGLGYSLVPWPARSSPNLRGVVAKRLRAPGSLFAIKASYLRGSERTDLTNALETLLMER